MSGALKKDEDSIHRNLTILIFALVIGTFSMFVAASFRDFMDSILQLSVPLSERSIHGGGLLVSYRFLYFLIVLSILVALSVLLS